MKKYPAIAILMASMLLSGCTTYYRISQDYKNKPVEKVTQKWGEPTRTESLTGGMVLRVYEKSKVLRAAPINTGQYQYDKFESPMSVKNEVFLFYVDSSGIVRDVKYDYSYNR